MLHPQERAAAISILRLAIDSNDVWVLESCKATPLTRDRFSAFVQHHFERDKSVQRKLPGEINRSEASFAQQPLNSKVTNLVAPDQGVVPNLTTFRFARWRLRYESLVRIILRLVGIITSNRLSRNLRGSVGREVPGTDRRGRCRSKGRFEVTFGGPGRGKVDLAVIRSPLTFGHTVAALPVARECRKDAAPSIYTLLGMALRKPASATGFRCRTSCKVASEARV